MLGKMLRVETLDGLYDARMKHTPPFRNKAGRKGLTSLRQKAKVTHQVYRME